MLLLLLATAMAGSWKDQPIEPRLQTDFTAHTVHRGELRLGLWYQDLGVLDNLQLGTSLAGDLFGLWTVHGKVTAIREGPFEASIEAAWMGMDLERRFGVPGGRARLIPIGVTASWVIAPRWSIHGGASWTSLDASGQVAIDQLAQDLAVALQVDLGDELTAALADAGAVYGGAGLLLTRVMLAGELRLDRRDSIVLISRSYLRATGRLDAGYQDEGGVAEVGAAVRVDQPLAGTGSSVTTLSWQFSWPHLHLRLGVGLPVSTGQGWAIPPGVLTQAFTIYWRG